MRTRKKIWFLYSLIPIVIAIVVGIGIYTRAFGMFSPKEPYVKGEPDSIALDSVTDEGKNWIGEMGTGAKPATSDVPTCEGKKGTKDNPFVILEIVADKAQQQMGYLAMDENETKPLDVLQYGIDTAAEQKRSYVPGSSSIMGQDNLKEIGQWFCNWKYSVYKIGKKAEKESIPYTEIAKLYNVEITSNDLEKAGVSTEAFDEQLQKGKTQKFSREVYDVPALIKKYPDFFEKDSDKNTIRKPAKEDINNWSVKKKTEVVKEAEEEIYKKTGYLVAVEPGKGEFGFASESDASNFIFTKMGTDADRWIYVEKEEDLPEGVLERYTNRTAQIGQYGFWNNETNIGWTDSTSELYNYDNNQNGKEASALTGMMLKLSDNSNLTSKYVKSPQETKDVYTFSYYGLKNNNVLKRQLFHFTTQEAYDDFYMQVICMTPSELNAIGKKDTKEKVDMIERADMFYLGSYDSETNNIANVYKLYYKYVENQKDYQYDSSKVAEFMDEDLDWNLCFKLIYRLCNNKNLPLVMTNRLGNLEKYGTADVKMYQSKKTPNVTRKATLNNLAKLYIIASQFDLTAKKEEDESYIRTFYDDILMTGKLEQIVLNDTAKTDAKTPADNTGYYVRPKTIETDDLTEKQKCYYLWNSLTFYPEADEMDALWSTDSQCNINVDKFVSYGYNRSYFDVNDASNIFTSSKMGMKAKGSDGEHGNVAIPQNANNENYSTLLGNTENADVLNVAMDTAFQIMNNRPETVNNLVVKALKQAKKYVKLADDSVLIDYSSDRSYTSETSYLKVQIHDNNNTEDGLVTKISLKNESGETAPGSNLILYTTKDMTTACEKTTYSGKTGYQVKTSAPLIAYIPYSIKDWAKGYNIIEFETVGRTYSERKKKTIMGSPVTSQITIGERTLFSLE